MQHVRHSAQHKHKSGYRCVLGGGGGGSRGRTNIFGELASGDTNPTASLGDFVEMVMITAVPTLRKPISAIMGPHLRRGTLCHPVCVLSRFLPLGAGAPPERIGRERKQEGSARILPPCPCREWQRGISFFNGSGAATARPNNWWGWQEAALN